jgi:hypothetical protein
MRMIKDIFRIILNFNLKYRINRVITNYRTYAPSLLRRRLINRSRRLYFIQKIEVLKLILKIVQYIFNKEEKRPKSTFVKLFLAKNEEWRGFIGEQKHEWAKSKLTQDQIKRKEILFFIGFFWGKFKVQFQSLRVLSWIKLMYK